MTSLIFDTCCGCIELKSGCLIIGYLQLVGEVIYIVLGLIGLIMSGMIAEANGFDLVAVGGMVIALSIILLLILFTFLAFTIVLLVGLHQGKRGHIKVYLVAATVCLVLALIMTLASLSGPVYAADVICRIISYLLSAYFLLVIRSYYYKMDEKNPPVYSTA